jgi:hypothetical protein
MLITRSAQVLADSHEMKCIIGYFSMMAGWCSEALAKVVFPIPQPPIIATRAGSQRSMSMRSLSSESRPWNIFGDAGRREREPELWSHKMNASDEIMTNFTHLVFNELLPI